MRIFPAPDNPAHFAPLSPLLQQQRERGEGKKKVGEGEEVGGSFLVWCVVVMALPVIAAKVFEKEWGLEKYVHF